MSRAVIVRAPAKINLTLELLGRRPDGYHELASVFATIGLADRVRVAPSRRLDVRVAPPVGVPANEDLAARAVQALAAASGRAPLAHVRVKKRIPVGAGLGGGSSDAGAVLRGLARVWRVDGIDLGAVGVSVGSDVPFFASGAAFAHVRGRGERVEPLRAPAAPIWVALVLLNVRVSTATVFAEHRGPRSDGERTSSLVRAFTAGTVTPSTVRDAVSNDLVEAAERVAPAIREARQRAATLGIDLAMSGSGPTLFAIADDRVHALRIARHLRRAQLKTRVLALGDIV